MGNCERNVKVIRRIQFAQTMMGSKDLLQLHFILSHISCDINMRSYFCVQMNAVLLW